MTFKKNLTKKLRLYIDTTNAEKIIVGLDDEIFETDSKQDKSQKLLPFIIEVLTKNGKDFKDIKYIDVNAGPGSFTGIRIGVSVANALSYVLKIRVNGKRAWKEGPVVPIYGDSDTNSIFSK